MSSLPLIPDRTQPEYAPKFPRRRSAWHVDSYPPLRSLRTHPERLLDGLELSTFYDINCRAGSADFNASKMIKKYAGLTRQMRWGILTVLAQLSAPSPPGLIPAWKCGVRIPNSRVIPDALAGENDGLALFLCGENKEIISLKRPATR